MSAPDENVNPYELLGLAVDAVDADIRKAYRQRSLKVHPDRNPNNPDAARKFHELNQAYELLLDPLRRMALDAKLRLQEAKKARFASYDAKRKGLVEELEERERAFKKARVETEAQKRERWINDERIMDEGRRLREEREKELQRKEREMAEVSGRAQPSNDPLEPPEPGTLDTTVRLKYPLSSHASLTTAASLAALLSPFGPVDEASIVLMLKPAPPKKPKRVVALVPFRQVSGAFSAVCASGQPSSGLSDLEVDWAEGKEPELIGWLKKMGKLGSSPVPGVDTKKPSPPSFAADSSAGHGAQAQTTSSDSDAFSSFPSTFPAFGPAPPQSDVPGLDYESLTLMRMRQAERARLEREIREQDAAEGAE